jgi:hypothetical protein
MGKLKKIGKLGVGESGRNEGIESLKKATLTTSEEYNGGNV